jgi:hypothetical protein
MNYIYRLFEEDIDYKKEKKNIKEYSFPKCDDKITIYKSDYVENNKDALILGYIKEKDYKDEIEDLDDLNIFLYKKGDTNSYVYLDEDEDISDSEYDYYESDNDKLYDEEEYDELYDEEVNYYYIINKKQGKFSSLIGYIKVDEDTYIGIYKRIFLIIWWFPLILLLLIIIGFSSCYSSCSLKLGVKDKHVEGSIGDKNLNIKTLADTVLSDGNVTNNDKFIPVEGSIEFSGYDLVYADSESPYILLENPKSNDVYFTYTIIDNETNEVILPETGLIKPGTALKWNAYETLTEGEYQVSMKIFTYDMEDTSITYTPAVMNKVTLKIY